MDPKLAAAIRALEFVRDGMDIGLGTGSTSKHFIDQLGAKVRDQGWKVRGAPTSERSRIQAQQLGIPIIDLSEVTQLDLAVDGADEADASLSLIKGGGGALLREKLVAAAAREFIVVADSTKFKTTLGAFPLPVAVVPFGWTTTAARLEKYGVEATLRLNANGSGEPYITDDGLYIIDMHFGRIEDPATLERELKSTTGIAEVGLFVGIASSLILGFEDGHTELKHPAG